MDFCIQPGSWGFCLFSFNVYPDILAYYKNPENPKEDLFQSLIRHIGPSHFVCDFNLLGFHDLICVFKESLAGPDEEDRHSVIEKIAEWSYQLSRLKEHPNTNAQILRQATERIWSELLSNVPKVRGRIRKLNFEPPTGNAFHKIPSLYNYTHDALVPLYPDVTTLEKRLKELKKCQIEDTPPIIAFSFLRIDPRVMAICDPKNPDMPSCWEAYHAVLQQLNTFQEHVVAVWAGLGTAQLIVLWSCESISKLADIRVCLRNKTNVHVPGNKRHSLPYSVVSTSSTLIAFPKKITTENISFSILVRLWSGFHGQAMWDGLRAIAKDVGLDAEKLNIGDRQGLFDGVISIPAGMPYTAVREFIQVLNCGCPFVEDVATFVRHEGEKGRAIVNDYA